MYLGSYDNVQVIGVGYPPAGFWEPVQPAYGPPAPQALPFGQGLHLCPDCDRCPGCGRKHSDIPPKPAVTWC